MGCRSVTNHPIVLFITQFFQDYNCANAVIEDCRFHSRIEVLTDDRHGYLLYIRRCTVKTIHSVLVLAFGVDSVVFTIDCWWSGSMKPDKHAQEEKLRDK